MSPRNALATPLALVHAAACGSSGLNGRALAAAMWSRATRFTLVDGDALGVRDVMRVALCPLFDGSTPWPARLQGLLACALDDSPEALLPEASGLHLITAPQAAAQPFPAWPEGPASRAPLLRHHGADSFVTALGLAAAQLRAAAAAPDRPAQLPPVAPHAVVAATDSMFEPQLLGALHRDGHLSTEQQAEGIIPSEAAAVLAVSALPHPGRAHGWAANALGILHGACAVPCGPSPAKALNAAIEGALQSSAAPQQIDTVLWDIGSNSAYLTAVAETVATLSPLTAGAQFVRPLQYIGCTAAAFEAVAVVLALEGCRAGLTSGGRTLICTLHDDTASAVWLEAPWHPNIMLADAPATAPGRSP